MRKMKEVGMKLGSVLLSGVMALSLLIGIPFNDMNQVEAAALSNPSTDSAGVVTWDCVYFGKYPQSDATGKVKDPIKWRVLSVEGDDAFLIADCNLDAWQYYTKFEKITWEMCTMRSWLNGYGPTSNSASISYTYDNFIDQAFSTDEQNAIKTTTVTPDTDNGGNETQDKIYLLSYSDALNPDYGFSSETTVDKARERVNTAYVAAGGSAANLYDVNVNGVGEANWWWLRTPGTFTNNACYVGVTGSIANDGYVDTGRYAVCPVLHLDLTQTSLWFHAGTVSSDGTCNEIAYPAKTLSSIKVEKVKTVYEVGDVLNVDDITVTAVYSTGEETKVTAYETNADSIDMETEGMKELLISYTEGDVTKTITVEIEVTKPEETSPEEVKELTEIKAEKVKKAYEVGEELNVDDITVTAVYSTGEETKVTAYETNADSIDMTTEGTKELLISYTEGTVTQTITIEITVTKPAKELTAIKAEKVKTAYEVGEELSVEDLTVTAMYSSGEESKVEGFETNATSIDMETEGTKELLISYTEGDVTKTITIEIEVTKPEETSPEEVKTLSSIRAEKVKTAYKVGNVLNVDDITVTAVYSTGEETKVTAYETNADSIDMTTEGTQELLISYTEGTVTQTITIEITVTKPAKELTAIKAEKVKTAYEVGEEFSVEDLTVTAVYSDGEMSEVTAYETNADSIDMTTEGTKELLISYTEGTVTKTTTIEIEVTKPEETSPEEVKTLSSIRAEKVKTAYEVGDVLNVDDITVTAVYSTAEEAEVTVYETNADSIDMTTEGTKELLISYTEGTVTQTITIEITVTKPAKELTAIKAEKTQTTYEVGEELSVDDITVTAMYSSGEESKVEGFETNATSIDMETEGTKTLLISYTEGDVTKTTTIEIEVTQPEETSPEEVKTLSSIRAEKVKTAYEVGDVLNVDDITVTAVYSTGEETKVTAYETDADSIDMTTEGTQELLISYTEGTVTQTITIEITVTKPAKELTAIKAEKVKTAYEVGEELSVDDITVTAMYSSGEESKVEGFETNADSIDMTTEGTKTLLISYTEGDVTKTTTVEIEVTKPEETSPEEPEEVKTLSSIRVEKVKTAYEVGDVLNVDDITVTAVYSTGEEAEVTVYETNADSIDMTTEGTKTLLVTYTEGDVTKTTTIEIEVTKPEETSPEEPDKPEDDDSEETYDVSLVRIKAEKEKITYEEGEELTLDDLKVTAVYSDGDEVFVTEYTTNASEIDMTKAGVKDLIVTYKEDDVEKKAIVSIEVVERYDEEDDDNIQEDDTVYISKIEITGISKKIAAGKKVKLTAKVTPSNASNQKLIWSSSNKKYATVNQKGQVTLKKKGIGKNVTITAKTTDGSGVKATYTIRIMKHAVKKLTIKGKKVQTVKAGRSIKLKTTIKTTGKSVNKILKWKSSNTKYATVSQKGKVKTKKAGKGKKVKITAMATDGSNKKATVTIKIK